MARFMRSPTDSNQAITGTSGGTIKAITKWIDSGCQRHLTDQAKRRGLAGMMPRGTNEGLDEGEQDPD